MTFVVVVAVVPSAAEGILAPDVKSGRIKCALKKPSASKYVRSSGKSLDYA